MSCSVQLVSQLRLTSTLGISPHSSPAPPPTTVICKKVGGVSRLAGVQCLCPVGRHTQFVYSYPGYGTPGCGFNLPPWSFLRPFPLLWGRQALSPSQGSLPRSRNTACQVWDRCSPAPQRSDQTPCYSLRKHSCPGLGCFAYSVVPF